MKLRYTALAAAMVLALSACGKKDEPAAQAPANRAYGIGGMS